MCEKCLENNINCLNCDQATHALNVQIWIKNKSETNFKWSCLHFMPMLCQNLRNTFCLHKQKHLCQMKTEQILTRWTTTSEYVYISELWNNELIDRFISFDVSLNSNGPSIVRERRAKRLMRQMHCRFEFWIGRKWTSEWGKRQTYQTNSSFQNNNILVLVGAVHDDHRKQSETNPN